MSGIVDVKFPILKEKKTTQIFRLLLSSFVYYGAVTSVVALVSKHSAGVIFLVALTPGWLVMVMNMVIRHETPRPFSNMVERARRKPGGSSPPTSSTSPPRNFPVLR